MRTVWQTLTLAGLLGCGTIDAPPPADTEFQRDAIIGGTVDPGDPEVFGLLMQGNNGAGAGCTATLIAPRTLLTAAHCIDPRVLGATSVQIFAHNKPNESQVGFNELVRVVETRMHPGWNGQGTNDIGMALLERASPVTPKPWNDASVSNLTGRPIRAVGYGANAGGANPTGGGVKRQVALSFRMMFQDVFFLGDQVGRGVCHGDSGGPSFHTFPDGVERVVGVHSFTVNEACTDGADSRVDFFAGFVRQWLNEKEAPSCSEDGRCAMNCPTPDIDCLCGRDGQCTVACPDPGKDPDCPVNCRANGICSLEPCPVKDVDCIEPGQTCANANQCPGRLCVGDNQHLDPYCSSPCSNNAACWSGGECDTATGRCRWQPVPETPVQTPCTPGASVCAQASRCLGVTADKAYCTYRCADASECQPGATCDVAFDGSKFCNLPRPTVFLPYAHFVEQPASGCSTGLGLMPALVVALVLRRRRFAKHP